ncbi:hypothetical protein [Nannocystis radixulma]|uniref:Right handed beta helix region n=1 Tax=Nannocystis radixulma TaxID=2995305 RepID=A0ABT5AWT0_9BACT|nr:hypothetical protein [Nannocystis radixulma]MDC0666290.1 hypothetical protein [Nannocystis radixulma]
MILWVLASCGDSGGAEGSGSESGTTDTSTGTGTTADVPTTTEPTTGDPCPMLPETVDTDMDFGPGCVRMYRTNIVDGATLTLVAGTTVHVDAGGFLHAGPANDNSALVIEGTEAEPVQFRSAAEAPQAGDWQCVRIGNGSSASRIVHARFEHGGQACDAIGSRPETTLDIHAPAEAFSYNEVRASASHGVILGDNALIRGFEANTFADNARASLRVAPAALLRVPGGQVFVDADDVVEVEGTFDAIEEPGTWSAQTVPYRLLGYVQVNSDGDVTVEAGTVVQLDGSSLEVFAGKLRVAGTEAAPVLFTSAQDGPQAGDWGCVVYTSVGAPPQIEHAIFEYAGNGQGCTGAEHTAALAGPATMELTGVTFRELAAAAIHSNDACNPAWCDNTFEGVDPLFDCLDPPMCP